jgi:hypothetical protein
LVVGRVLVVRLLSEPALVWGLLLELQVECWVLSPLEAIVSGFGGPLGPKISAALWRASAVGPSLAALVPSLVLASVVMPWAVLLAALVPWPVQLAALVLWVSGVIGTFVLAVLWVPAKLHSLTMARQMMGRPPLGRRSRSSVDPRFLVIRLFLAHALPRRLSR